MTDHPPFRKVRMRLRRHDGRLHLNRWGRDRPPGKRWGFYLPSGWVDEHTYDQTVRAEQRDLWNEVPAVRSS